VTLSAVIGACALALTGAALVCGALALVATRRPALALGVLLDLLLAAGLLRLTGVPGWSALTTAASIVALRRLVGFGLRTGGRTWSGAPRAPRKAGPLRSLTVRRLVRPAWRL
jgi:hypothetical protein